ncbi:hypothetical protein [Aeromicrobium sp. 179-A 4D2 NHS]|uniref:hypothetical protein n=1 Tax=Aeromicrobium sp. 179-A 4D2 NHS TaxID=3142375 RepID=UPI0039A278BE
MSQWKIGDPVLVPATVTSNSDALRSTEVTIGEHTFTLPTHMLRDVPSRRALTLDDFPKTVTRLLDPFKSQYGGRELELHAEVNLMTGRVTYGYVKDWYHGPDYAVAYATLDELAAYVRNEDYFPPTQVADGAVETMLCDRTDDDDIPAGTGRDRLRDWLLAGGWAEEKDGYGHATADDLADALLTSGLINTDALTD